MFLRRLCLTASLLALCCPVSAVAQVPDAGRVEEQLNLTPQPQAPLTPERTPPRAVSNPLPGAQTARFTLRKIEFKGSTVYAPADLQVMAAPLLNREVSVADIYALAAQITDRYRADGYVVAQAFVPPQAIRAGIIRIDILEPYISEVIVAGDAPRSAAVRRLVAPWRQNKLMNVHDLERTLLLINDLPGVKVQSVLEPQTHAAAPGAMVLRLIFDGEPMAEGRVSFDNYGSKYIGPYQVGGGVSLNNAFWHMAQTDIQAYVTTQIQELMYGNIAHHIPLPAEGLMLDLGASYSRVVPGGSLDLNDIKSRSRVFSLGVTQSVIRSRSMNLSLSAALESRTSTTKTLGIKLSEDRLSVAMLEAIFENADRWGGFNDLNLRLRHGLDILGARKTGSADLSRAEGHSDFTSLQMQASRLQPLGDVWALFMSLRGQYAWNPLLSNEEFGYGGNAVGRAYNASEIVGDRGVSGIIEARYTMRPLGNLNLSPYVFYDIGKVWNTDSVDGDDFSGASTGIGLRGGFVSGLTFDVMVAKPLTRRLETPQIGDGDSPVMKFSLEYRF